jgi:hypothetical protein
MTETEYHELMDNFDKEFKALIPPCPTGTLAFPLIEMTEVHFSPEWDEWFIEMGEKNKDFPPWKAIKFRKGEHGFTQTKVIIHSDFVAMNCVQANKNKKLDWILKEVDSLEDGRFKKWDDGEWKDV